MALPRLLLLVHPLQHHLEEGRLQHHLEEMAEDDIPLLVLGGVSGADCSLSPRSPYFAQKFLILKFPTFA